MQLTSGRLLAGLIAIWIAAQSVGAAKADAISDITGMLTDPLKLGRASDNFKDTVERMLRQLQALEGNVDAHAQDRLKQIRSILEGVIGKSKEAIDRALTELSELENKVNNDAVNLLYRGQCLAEVAATDQAQRAYLELIKNIRKSGFGLQILGIKVVDVVLQDVEITDPDLAWRSTRDALFKKLNSQINDSSDAYEILSGYQNLERGARFTRCHYQDQVLAIRMTREINQLEIISGPWVNIVEPQ
jgi:polyhydroxyalkanoate synthesis regulator phasin